MLFKNNIINNNNNNKTMNLLGQLEKRCKTFSVVVFNKNSEFVPKCENNFVSNNFRIYFKSLRKVSESYKVL